MSIRLPAPLTIKIWCGGLGLALGIAGMVLERHWLVWIAVALLGMAFLARFLRGPAPSNG
jgi:hypothetical protein